MIIVFGNWIMEPEIQTKIPNFTCFTPQDVKNEFWSQGVFPGKKMTVDGISCEKSIFPMCIVLPA